MLSTHFDCVPPFVPARRGRQAAGRGSCDAKGTAGRAGVGRRTAPRNGERRVGLVFVVGEEGAATGARTANGTGLRPGAAASSTASRPTTPATATRGILRVSCRQGEGSAFVTTRPWESAIDKLLDALVRLRAQALPEDPLLRPHPLHHRPHFWVSRPTSFAARRGGGDVPHVGPLADLEPALVAIRDLSTPLTCSQCRHPAHTFDGFAVASFPFTTDIPFSTSGVSRCWWAQVGAARAHHDEHVGSVNWNKRWRRTKRSPHACALILVNTGTRDTNTHSLRVSLGHRDSGLTSNVVYFKCTVCVPDTSVADRPPQLRIPVTPAGSDTTAVSVAPSRR